MWAGWVKGFITGITDLVIWLAVWFLLYLLSECRRTSLQAFPSLGVWGFPLGFILTVIISRILLSVLLTSLSGIQLLSTSVFVYKAFGVIRPYYRNYLCRYCGCAALSVPMWNGLAKKPAKARSPITSVCRLPGSTKGFSHIW
jgi:hypothetical protein